MRLTADNENPVCRDSSLRVAGPTLRSTRSTCPAGVIVPDAGLPARGTGANERAVWVRVAVDDVARAAIRSFDASAMPSLSARQRCY